MMDDINVIAQRDTQDALGFATSQPAQLAHNFGVVKNATLAGSIQNIVVAGMGGSALAAELAQTWPQLHVPLIIVKNYDLPAFVDESTLVIAASFSGNTEETLAALQQAEAKKAQIATIAHGGKLAEIAAKKGYLLAELPACPQPRMGVFYAYRALIEILVAAKLVPQSCIEELAALEKPLQAAVKKWAPAVPTVDNYAKQLAEQMIGKTPIIYAGPKMSPAAYKWKISVNENAKNTAWCGALPEMNHNEFIGWSSHPVEKPFAAIDLRSKFELPRIQERFELTDKLLSGRRPAAVEVWAEGDSVLEHLLFLVLLGDFTSMYMGLLNGVDPTPIDLVEKLKKELRKE